MTSSELPFVILTAGLALEPALFELFPTHIRKHLGSTYKEALDTVGSIAAVLIVHEDKGGFASWHGFLQVFRARFPASFIICAHKHKEDSQEDAYQRIELFASGASMVTFDASAIRTAVILVRNQVAGKYGCLYCRMSLSEDSLWLHTPLYHVNEKNKETLVCPICRVDCVPRREPFAVHLRNMHGPCARGEVPSEYDHPVEKLYAFSLIVCVREMKGKKQMLLVQEFAASGFWLPGGRVDNGEKLEEAALRECKEEAGCDINLVGILQFQYTPSEGKSSNVRLRVVFFAEPKDPVAELKTIPDFESVGATWVDFQDVEELYSRRNLRGQEPARWMRYLSTGGIVHPLSALGIE